MQSYPTRATTPSRMSRKQARRAVFMANKRATCIRRKAERLSRKSEQGE